MSVMGITREQTLSSVVGAICASDEDADALMAPVYAELRALAASFLRNDHGHTLQPTALVNEAYLKLAGDRHWESPAHFLATAAKTMRHILIDHARAKKAAKRGGGRQREQLSDVMGRDEVAALHALEAALTSLEAHDERAGKVVELKFFGGMTNEEVASVLGISRTTVASDWRHARAWLRREMERT